MRITVGLGSCGIAAGASQIYEQLKSKNLQPTIVGCNGMCYLEPIVTVDGRMYTNVTSSDVERIINDINRVALRNCGIIDPTNIDEYIERGGYKPLTLSPEEIIEKVKESGLCGRGGAGFPTWFKWDACRKNASDKKFLICNADEGDPGAFMDRAILEGDPHSVIEGMIIAAKAIGADEGYIYVRAEYPLAIKRLENAIKQAKERGFLKTLRIKLAKGAGAFVCGEETALIASIEAERGMPRLKPPFPAEKGLWNKPSNINNVETLANVPYIIHNNAKAATKVFAISGKTEKAGLVEVQIGATLRDVLGDTAGIKAVQLGGPSGGCIPQSLFDTEIDYAKLIATGAIMGSGGMVIIDENTCMVDMARFFLDFTVKESCGKCTHCRVGNKRMLEILERICGGNGKDGDIELLESLVEGVKGGSLCALGQTAPNPVLTTLKYFRNEYEDHIKNGKCRICAKTNGGAHYSIDNDKCVKCGICVKACKFGAVTVS
jgi:NADH-quinone oxidoreductase subunit F